MDCLNQRVLGCSCSIVGFQVKSVMSKFVHCIVVGLLVDFGFCNINGFQTLNTIFLP
jgi:hypothetical protein